MIDFRRGHTAVCGMTGTGKTTAALHYLTKWHGGVVFINTMHNPMPGWVKATGRDDVEQIERILDKGGKVNFLPSTLKHEADAQLGALINYFFRARQKDMIIAVDEAHMYTKSGLQAMIRTATTGRGWGIKLVPITQRLAKLNNDIMTQCPQKVIFQLENETKYCLGYGIPYPEMEPRIFAKCPPKRTPPEPSHAYCTYYAGQIEGAFMV